jgi:hypothetical protein
LTSLVEKAQIEALLTISDIADVLSDDPNSDFHVYLDRLLPIMFELISDIRKAELAMITLSTLGDIIRNLKPAVLLRYTQMIMTAVMESYYGASTRRGLLFAYVNVFADLALQLGGPFSRFITGPNCELLLLLKDYARVIKSMSPDDAAAAYSSLLITCAGILVDLRELGNQAETDSKAYLIEIIVPFVEQMICSDVDLLMCDDLLRDAAGVVGDVAQLFGTVAKPALDKPFLPLLMSRSRRSILAFATAAWSTKLLEEALSIKLDLNLNK